METQRPSVSWEEARGFLAFLLLAAAVFSLLAALFATIDADLETWRRGFIVFINVARFEPAILLLGAAMLIVSAPPGSLVPGLRTVTMWLALIMAVMGLLFVVNVLTLGSGTALGRIWPAFREGATNAILGGAAAWLCRRVELD